MVERIIAMVFCVVKNLTHFGYSMLAHYFWRWTCSRGAYKKKLARADLHRLGHQLVAFYIRQYNIFTEITPY